MGGLMKIGVFFVLEGDLPPHAWTPRACSPIEALLCTISISEQYLILWNRLQLAFINLRFHLHSN
jgi:hypothetical protein